MTTEKDQSKAGDYEVGFGKPPAASQFKSGQSGNPKGRPKKSSAKVDAFAAALSETVSVQENGQRRRISKLDAIAKQLANKAASGDARATQQVIRLWAVLEGKEPVEKGQEELDEPALEVVKAFLARMGCPSDPSDGGAA